MANATSFTSLPVCRHTHSDNLCVLYCAEVFKKVSEIFHINQFTPSAANKMSRPKQLQHQLQFHLLLLIVLIGLLPSIDARPQDIILDATQLDATQATAPTSPAINLPSDLSVGLNLVPVSSLIAAAANAEPPAPIQFVRIAMNSGL